MKSGFFTLALSLFLLLTGSHALHAKEMHLSLKCGEEYAYFTPPSSWDIIDPKFLSKSIKIGFTGKRHKDFAPSVNLTTEKTKVTIDEYIEIIKKIHTSRHNTFREIGALTCPSGTGRLVEIESINPQAGPVRLFQFILIKDQTAYILTACHLKTGMSDLYKEFQTCFKSFTLTSDPLDLLDSLDKKSHLQSLIETCREKLEPVTDKSKLFISRDFQKKYWLPLQNYLIKECKELGPVWQISVTERIRDTLLNKEP